MVQGENILGCVTMEVTEVGSRRFFLGGRTVAKKKATKKKAAPKTKKSKKSKKAK